MRNDKWHGSEDYPRSTPVTDFEWWESELYVDKPMSPLMKCLIYVLIAGACVAVWALVIILGIAIKGMMWG